MKIAEKAGVIAVYLFAMLAFASIAALLVAILGGLVYSAVNAGLLLPFSLVWSPESASYGIIPAFVGTLTTASLAVCIALPFAVGILACVWIYDNRLSGMLRWLMRFMSGIPTIVYSFCGLFVLVPLMRQMWGGSGYGLLTVSLVLAILILPTIVLVADSAIYPLLSNRYGLSFTMASIGVNRWKAFWYTIAFIQRRGVLTGVLLGFGRAVGDTMIALILSGNTPLMPSGITGTIRTLSGHISLLAATEINHQIEYTMFLSGFILFAIALLVSFCVSAMRERK